MALMDLDLVPALTQEGTSFESHWSSFLFNIPQALMLKTKAKEEEIKAVLSAGAGFQGTGWTTGRASKTLFEVSGKALVKAGIEAYRNVWLYSLSLLCGVDLPKLELDQAEAEAAFGIVSRLEEDGHHAASKPSSPTSYSGDDSDSEEEEQHHFDWDEPAWPLAPHLQALWQRSSSADWRIDIKRVLESHTKLLELPSKAPDNNLVPDYKKKADTFLRSISQCLLNLLRGQAHAIT